MKNNKKILLVAAVIFAAWIVANIGILTAHGYMSGIKAHKMMLYPIVRITHGQSAGSGTIIYSEVNDKGVAETYILTNNHVISSSIEITEEWDPKKKKDVKREKRDIVYVEIFQYKSLSTPVGTMRVEAEVVSYSIEEDMALVKLSLDAKQPYVATFATLEEYNGLKTFDESTAVGCSLAFPPLPSNGIITRLNMPIESYPYHMSSAQIIFGNSGGAMFNEVGHFIGIPSRVVSMGYSSVITHMGFFIPLDRIFAWLDRTDMGFIHGGK